MSRTKPTVIASNPTELKLEWVAHDEGGYFKAWDSDAKKELRFDLPLRFAYLDCNRTIGGFYEAEERGLYSNEITNLRTQELDVRYYKDGKQHTVAKGVYADIKGELSSKGGRFCNMVYASLLNGDDSKLVKLPLIGSSNTEWIELGIKDGESFSVTKFEDRKKGRTNYRAPILEKIEISEEEGVIADGHDEKLQEYFTALKQSRSEEVEEVAPEEPEDQAPENDDGDVIPF